MPRRAEQLQIRVTAREKAALKRRARAAGQDMSGYVLARALPDDSGEFGAILDALSDDADRRFALAELNDLLSRLAPIDFVSAVGRADVCLLAPLMQNYVAAMVEQAAQMKRVPAPPWIREVPPLAEPYFAVPFRTLRLHLLRAAPVAFRRRNIFVDAGLGARV